MKYKKPRLLPVSGVFHFKRSFSRCPCLQNPRVRLVHSGFSDFGTPKNPSFKMKNN